MKVWIATKGCYSDYSIVGVFSTKEAAQAVSGQYEGYSGGNEPYCLTVDELEGGYKKPTFWCHLERKTGKIVKQGVNDGYEVVSKTARVPEGSPSVFGTNSAHNDYIEGRSYVSAEHAVKLAVEYQQKLLRRKTEKATI